MGDPVEAPWADHYLGPVVEQHGAVSLDPGPAPFERLLVSTVHQQVSMAATEAIESRLFDRVEPTPDGILRADPDEMRDPGLSASNVDFVQNTARPWSENGWSGSHFADMSDAVVVGDRTTVRGIGTRTATMVLLIGSGYRSHRHNET